MLGPCGAHIAAPLKDSHLSTHTHTPVNKQQQCAAWLPAQQALYPDPPCPPLSLLADIKELPFTHTGTQLTGPREVGLSRISSIHYCTTVEYWEDGRNAKVEWISGSAFQGLQKNGCKMLKKKNKTVRECIFLLH